jgi:hypothetical protein
MRNTGSGIRHTWQRLALALVAIVALVAIAGCSSGGATTQGTNYSLILAGSTNDHASVAPTIAAGGPDGMYAFVYDNQIWLRPSGAAAPKQLTHLELSNGATLEWGPLVWSHSGRSIAFALVQDLNLNAGAPPRSDGPIYLVDTSSGNITVTPASGSIYGHTYALIGDGLLLYTTGSGLLLYSINNPRVWSVREIPTGPSSSGTPSYLFFGDVATSGGYVYYTRLDVKTPGHTGAVGTASLMQTYLGLNDSSATPSPLELAGQLPLSDAHPIASLGAVYTDAAGDFVAGAWQLRTGGGNPSLVVQHIDSVDASGGTVSSSICIEQYGSCLSTLMSKAASQPLAIRPQFAVSRSGAAAYTADGVYLQSASDKLGPAGWTTPPAWSPDGQTLAVTQLVGQSTDPSGATRSQTNVVVYQAGQTAAAGTTLIAGASNLSWSPVQ